MSKPTFRKSDWLTDWYVIEGTGADACVEGSLAEMKEIANAIKDRGSAHFKRCAVQSYKDHFKFWSPRNSMNEESRVSIRDADAIADEILATQDEEAQ